MRIQSAFAGVALAVFHLLSAARGLAAEPRMRLEAKKRWLGRKDPNTRATGGKSPIPDDFGAWQRCDARLKVNEP